MCASDEYECEVRAYESSTVCAKRVGLKVYLQLISKGVNS